MSLGLVFLPVAGAPARAAVPGVALALGGLAIGVPGAVRLVGLFASGAALGLVLPGGLARALVACALVVLIAALAVIWWNRPFTRQRIAPGLAYRAGGAERRVPQLRIRGAAPLLLRQRVLDTLVELAGYTDRLLTRNGIRYAAGCGTLLGAVRHGGMMPWDDDVDFFLYEGIDRRRMEELFERMAEEAERDGYRLFRHGSYWKLAPRGFWRYPVVDIYHTDWTHTQTAELLRVPWETGTICVPADAEARAVRQYGPDALHEVVHDIPFWDSGFVPSFVTRIFGYGAIARGSRLFKRLFAVTSK